MKRCARAILTLVVVAAVPAHGDEASPESANPPKELPILFDLDARRAVSEGNRLLIDGKPDVALQAYDYADKLRPEAREIDFVRGLAHFEGKEFEEARVAFRRVSATDDDGLGNDALYSLGTCDHTEGLDSLEQDPQLAVSLLENAMKRYQDVLAKQPEHKAARDANRKAARLWRELKRQLQEQQQQDQDECDNPKEGEKEDSQKNQQQQQDEKEQQQQSQTPEPNEQQEEEQPQESAQQQEEQQQKQQSSEAQQQEQASREQAERKLREMMQAQRQRQKMRRQHVQRIPVAQVDKDW